MLPVRTSESRPNFWLWVALPVVVAVWLRSRGIGGPAPFVDEGANILTALDPRVSAAFEPLAQGRPWLVYLFKPAGWFPIHALAVARGMSACAGLATMAALGWTLYRLAGRTAALCGLWLWAVLPFAVFHERLALQDPFVTALLAWAAALVTTGSLAANDRLPRWTWFVAAGGCFGAAFLLKISAALALPWLGLIYLAVQGRAGRRFFDQRLGWIALGGLAMTASLGTGLLQLGGNLGRYDALPAFWGTGSVAAALERTAAWLGWYSGYGGWPLALLAAGGLILAGRMRDRLALTCAAAWVVSLLVSGVFYHNTYARYLLPDHLPLLMFLALSWGQWLAADGRPRMVGLAVVSLLLARWGVVSWQIGTDPARAAVPVSEVGQYFAGPWSGRGLPEVRHWLTRYADEHQVSCLVITHRFLRPGCYGLMLTELGDPHIGVVPFTIYEPEELAAARPGLLHAAAGQRVAFFILYEGSIYPAHPWLDSAGSPTHRVLDVPRGPGESFTLYQYEP